ncbi:MAG: hypothetical protein C5B55_07425 [Blastocatellia bacterium]|nr:MAG: hypothetical protein C5B55_07425 [Blastocatellia bacterium]
MDNTLNEFLRELERSSFYGSVELKYENGRITLARKAETIKLDNSRQNHCRNNRGTNGDYSK